MWQLFVIAMVSMLSGPLVAAEITDATGRKVTVADRIERVMAAGPPATVVLYVLAPEKMIGWTAPPRPDEKPFLLQTYRRDMGGGRFVLLKEAAAPITVNGRQWGGLRLAFSF